MQTLFISDLHLSPLRPQINQLFFEFLDGLEDTTTDALYILGDLFEYWIGDDAADQIGHGEILQALRRLRPRDIPVYVMRGNRDFLLGAQFARTVGCELLPDPTVIDLYGQPAVLTHGDRLCTDDHKHQQFRDLVDDPGWQRNFLNKSITERIRMAVQARSQSEINKSMSPMAIMDVNPQAVVDMLRRHDARLLIHGHTHRPAMHRVSWDEVVAERIVLGDWAEQASVLNYRSGEAPQLRQRTAALS